MTRTILVGQTGALSMSNLSESLCGLGVYEGVRTKAIDWVNPLNENTEKALNVSAIVNTSTLALIAAALRRYRLMRLRKLAHLHETQYICRVFSGYKKLEKVRN